MPPTDPTEIQKLIEKAESALSSRIDQRVTLTNPIVLKDWYRSLILRCKWDYPVPSIIIKQIRENEACGFSDWASLNFLLHMPTSEFVPMAIAGDVEEKFYILVDLGQGDNLETYLRAGDDTATQQILHQLAEVMATIVIGTHERADEYHIQRRQFPEPDQIGRFPEAERWLEGKARIVAWAAALNINIPSDFDSAFELVAAKYRDPGAWLAFSHGDPAPSNNHIIKGRVRLIDFEYGAARHALYDLAAWWILCPLKEQWVRDMNAIFHHTLTTYRPQFADLNAFYTEWATMVAFRGLAMLTWIPLESLTENQAWVDDWTCREAMLSTTLRLYQAAQNVPNLAPIAEFASRMKKALQSRFPEHGDGEIRW